MVLHLPDNWLIIYFIASADMNTGEQISLTELGTSISKGMHLFSIDSLKMCAAHSSTTGPNIGTQWKSVASEISSTRHPLLVIHCSLKQCGRSYSNKSVPIRRESLGP